MKWLVAGSPAHQVLVKILSDDKRLKTLRLLNHGQHTGKLETLHSLILCYAPKRLDFDPVGYDIRVKLAVIDHNYNATRSIATGKMKAKGSIVCMMTSADIHDTFI